MDAKSLTAIAKSRGTICRLPFTQIGTKKNMRRFAVKASSSGESGHRSMVDEDMLVLRKRMHQIRMEEINYIPPQHWMEWEKKWYPTYDSDICSSLMWLQNRLLNTRPSVTMAVMALFFFSVPASLLLFLMESTQLISNLHV
ncbi:hypothetical protein SUGI_0107250 [Cryptomeria japonica]|uniref:uncharacterized protein LOC131073673 n=1 Tax=Cryptomeria japonica TaxID=3369 RepID=UPI002408B809|nr:uncharacterized protein LOC131073673 [Cryptomeria japonica]GLJ09355.1 hypothetical protein SUGI_0107250 [Cryptomeria japonica]